MNGRGPSVLGSPEFGLTACEIARGVSSGELSAGQVLAGCLARIGRIDPTLSAFVALNPLAEQQAGEIDAKVAAGIDPGPLAGVPIGVKDLEDAAGLPTRRGSRLIGADPRPSDSWRVARLKAAGAVVVGKTATPEFGSLPYTWSRLWGVTRNPWDPSTTPGGSSGGSAAAVAAGMVPIATGSDGGCSIRIPSAFCGLPGLKVTRGLIEETSPSAGELTVWGPLAHSVRDIARVWDLVAGRGESGGRPDAGGRCSFEAAVDAAPDCARSSLKIAWSATLGFGWCDPSIESVSRAAAVQLIRELGALEVDRPISLDDPAPAWITFWAAESLDKLKEFWPSLRAEMTPVVAACLSIGEHLDAEDLRVAEAVRFETCRKLDELFAGADLLITPTSPIPAYRAEGPVSLGAFGDLHANPLPGIEPAMGVCFSYPFNLSGHPAMSLPAGFDENAVPVGIQVVGPRFSERLLLAVARKWELCRPWPRSTALETAAAVGRKAT
jgi:aspartyl-tRNA(Asn)/glutamyl-tRNA(Gln) amidotransferase subunit A